MKLRGMGDSVSLCDTIAIFTNKPLCCSGTRLPVATGCQLRPPVPSTPQIQSSPPASRRACPTSCCLIPSVPLCSFLRPLPAASSRGTSWAEARAWLAGAARLRGAESGRSRHGDGARAFVRGCVI